MLSNSCLPLAVYPSFTQDCLLLPSRNDTSLLWALPSYLCTVTRENSLKNMSLFPRVSHSSLSKPILHLAIFKLCIAALFILWITYVVVFLICKSFWIKAFAKWINANVANPIAVLFIVREHVFIKRIFETVNHVIARRGAEKIKYKTSHASFPERVIFNKTSQSNNSNPMEVYCVLFTQDLQACIPGSSDPYIWETTSPSIILPDEFPCQGN